MLAGAIYSIGTSTLILLKTSFNSNMVINGAIITVHTSSLTDFDNIIMDSNEGGPMISVQSSELSMRNS
jgi:hypothetical protein